MHREYRPEELHCFDGGTVVGPAGRGALDQERALVAFTALLGVLVGGDVILGLVGWNPARAPYGLSLSMAAALLGAVYIVYRALVALSQRRIGADLALAQACLAALVLGQPFVAAEVVFIALVGEVLEAWTFARTRRALGRLVDQTPRSARVRRDGADIEIPADQLKVGDRVIIRPGERIAVDGSVTAGRSSVDQSALTGESLPLDRGPGDAVFTGTLNQFGVIEVHAEKVGSETTYAQVLGLVSQARRKKARLEKVADRLARYFLPVVELAAAATLLLGYLLGWPDAWSRTVAVLVVACPCGLVLATPAAMLASMAWLARHGVLIKGGSALESLAGCDTFAFDKTGTLTAGTPRLASLVVVGDRAEADVLRWAASAETTSRHPLATALLDEARRRSLPLAQPREATLLPGAGVRADCVAADGSIRKVLVGNRRLLDEAGMSLDDHALEILAQLDARGETALLAVVDGELAGVFGVHDAVRPEAHDVVHDLRHQKIKEIAILTGDRAPAAKAVARRIHADTVEPELLPAEKAHWIEERRRAGRRVAMVGDGINDAPALAGANAGIALGGMGADLAAEAGDLIVLGDPLRVLPDLVRLSRATVAIIRQNIIGFAFGLNAVAMLSATFGILGPVAAAILHQAGSLLVLLNSMRLLVFGDWEELAPVRRLRALGAWIGRLDDRIDLEGAWGWIWARRRALVAAACAVLLVVYAGSGWTTVGPGEAGVLQRFGRYQGLLGPGLHLRWPWPIERVTIAAPDRIRSLEIGFRAQGDAAAEPLRWESTHGRPLAAHSEETQSDMTVGPTPISLETRASGDALLLTGDGRYVELTATLQYSLDRSLPDSPRRFVLGVADGASALRPLAEAAVREVIGRRQLVELLTSGRRDAEVESARLLQARLAEYGFGVSVRTLSFQDIHPPLAVLDAYRDISRAVSDRQRRINEANAYRDRVLAEAAGKSAALREGALGFAESRQALAASEADRFSALCEVRRIQPVLTDVRFFWDELASALGGKLKVIVDEEPGRRRHLFLPGLPPEQTLPLVSPAPGSESNRTPAASDGRPARKSDHPYGSTPAPENGTSNRSSRPEPLTSSRSMPRS
jgi:Cu+-exporting ATPase